jgi:hypothetical protein
MSGLVEFVVYFLIICAAVAVACSLIRERDWSRICNESTHFFLMLVIGILGFSATVYVLEWIFIRRL